MGIGWTEVQQNSFAIYTTFFQIMIRQDHFENILYFSKVKLTPLHMILK